jgi:hypothetical protein
MAPGTGLAGQAPTRLMPFAYDWAGGDIHGLSGLAGTLYGYPPKMADVVTALDKKVGQIVGDAGWQGSAAKSFSSHWDLTAAEKNENAFTKVLDTRVSDMPGLSKLADGLADDSILAKALDLPVVDVLAGGAVAGLSIAGDIGGAAKSVWHGITSLF